MNLRVTHSRDRNRAHGGSPRTLALLALVALGLSGACGTLESRKLQPAGTAGQDDEGTGGSRPAGGRGGTSNSGRSGSTGNGQAGDFSAALCGDGVREGDEGCDDGNLRNHDGCSKTCAIEPADPACGDGVVEGDEACDDGNLQAGDGCNASCRTEECGNARLDPGEECDPPEGGECTSHCIVASPHCGDGDVQKDEGEQCDDGNDKVGDGCSDCRKDCGDGRIDRSQGEECEPAYSDHCSSSCLWLPTCGDGEVQANAGEECDPSGGNCVDCKLVPSSCDGEGGGGCGGGGGDCIPETLIDLVRNGAFTSDTNGWNTPASVVTLNSVDDGSPDPKALEVAFDTGPVRAVSGANQCVPIAAHHSYELTAQYLIPAAAPAGVAASVTAVLYAGTRCDGTPVGAPQAGPIGEVRGEWTPYAAVIDTSNLTPGAEARLFLRLNVLRPADTSGARVLWDSVSIPDTGARCGNCVLDAGETCDDGNQRPGDGCSADCTQERCGDGVRSGAEACDDGNAVYATGDACTPTCKLPSTCDVCAAGQCTPQAAACLGVDGSAEAGPAAGTARSTLCDALRVCVRDTACNLATRKTAGVEGAFAENCYCGTSGNDCFTKPGAANGSCKNEVESALETIEPASILSRFDGAGTRYPLFDAMKDLVACENAKCSADCARAPACGNGHVEDRNLTYTFTVGGQDVQCDDQLTATNRGCSFEECDDGNLDSGDGCDQYCFLEACGNNVTQTGEDCDDGNRKDLDGCSKDCKAESHCGADGVEPPFEECDPPDAPGAGKLCTTAEYASHPDQCGCDLRCQRLVCGDGMVQRPDEECDPPNELTSCGENCKYLDQGPCQACINDSPTAVYDEAYCKPDALCVAVKKCVIRTGCFVPVPGGPSVPAACYCGPTQQNLDQCDLPDFVPQGPCATEMKAAGGDDQPNNEQILNRLFTFGEYPLSNAISIVDQAAATGQPCFDACWL